MKKYLLSFILIIMMVCGCREESRIGTQFQEYLKTDKSRRLIDPYSYAEHLRKTRFVNHELDSLPRYAIILHDTQIEEYLSYLGINKNEVERIQLGQVNPNYLYIIRKKSGANFILNPGLAGAGGISSQAAILGALGVKYIVHIGTCGLFGRQISDSSLIVSSGAYNDGGAMLIEPDNDWPRIAISYSDPGLSDLLFQTAKENGTAVQKSYGITVPIFFFQPVGFVKYALDEKNFENGEVPYYIEMEGAPLFAIGRLMNTKTASLVAGTDRYIAGKDSIRHSFVAYDADKAKKTAVSLAIEVFNKLEK